jgi:hypothetical protein
VSTPFPPAPAPPAAIEPEATGRGCLKKSLIGCGVVALVVAVCFIAFFLYVRQRPETITDVVMSQVESHFAADVTAEEKEQVRSAYADFRAALKEHRVSREPLDRMRSTLVSGGAQSEVSREQVRDLTALFRRAAGSRAAPAAAATPGGPVPSPRATP